VCGLLQLNSHVGHNTFVTKTVAGYGGSNISDSSPRSTGPAGSQFEAKVGTHYALALLRTPSLSDYRVPLLIGLSFNEAAKNIHSTM
jgi:hypothetical protein